MRLVIAILLISLKYFNANGQSKKIDYDFTQIDSLVDLNLKILGIDSFVVAHQVWYVGSYVSNKTKRLYYDNPFEIIFYYRQNGKYYSKKIDNIGESKSQEFDSKVIFDFLNQNVNYMKNEELTVKTDTIFFGDTLMTATTSLSSHQRVDRIWINYGEEILSYHFPEEYLENKWNLTKKQYLFLQLLQEQYNIIRKKLKTK